MNTTSAFQVRLAALCKAVSGTVYTERDLCRISRGCRDFMYTDIIEHGGKIEDPFFNYVVKSDIAIFTVFDDPFLIYAFTCDEPTLIRDFERFAMSEVKQCKEHLAATYNKVLPDIEVRRSIAELWMETC